MGNRAVIYCRISKQDPGAPKVEEQEARCRTLAASRGYDVCAVYVDDGISAYQSKVQRPGWDELCQAIADSSFDVLLFDRQDRLARDQFATLRLMADCGYQGIRWHSVTEGEIDLGQAPHLLMATYRGTDAESYSRKIQENVRRRNASDRQKGLPGAGPRPFGYDRSRMIIVEPEAALIREAVARLLGGATKWEVVNLFNESGLPTTRKKVHCPSGSCGDHQSMKERAQCSAAETHTRVDVYSWRPPAVYDVVGRWRNAGLVEHKGEVVGRGIWPAIVSEDDVRSVRAILATPAREWGGQPPMSLLTSIARCYCGERMHAHAMQWARVYRCASMDDRWSRNDFDGRHTAIKIETLDALARNAVISTYLMADAAALDRDGEAMDVAHLHVAMSELQRRNHRLVEALTASNSRMSVHAFGIAQAKLNAEADRIQERLDEAARSSAHARMMIEARSRLWGQVRPDLEAARDVRLELAAQFDALSLLDRRRLVSGTVSLTVYPGRGAGRVEVRHLVVPELDDDHDVVGGA